jgi:hypothetical protein
MIHRRRYALGESSIIRSTVQAPTRAPVSILVGRGF